MPTYINLDDFHVLITLLDSMKVMGFLEPAGYIVTWEKKPRLTINRLGNFEFQNPQQVYGVMLTFWDDMNNTVCNRKFVLSEKFQDKED